MDIADKIKFLRTKILDISQVNFAKKIGVTRMTIKNWEDGLSKPTITHITMIALICGVSTNYLIYDDHPLDLCLINLNKDGYNLLKNLIEYFSQQNTEGNK